MCSNVIDRYFHEAVRSILGQSFTDFEFIVVLNGEAVSACNSLRDLYPDERLRFLVTDGRGLCHALNLGLVSCRAPLVARMDADDVAHPERLARTVGVFRSDEAIGVVGTAITLIDNEGRAVGEKRFPLDDKAIRRGLTWTNPMAHPSVTFKRDLIMEQGGYAGLPYVEDLDLWLKIATASKTVRFANLREPLLGYRTSAPGANRRKPLTFLAVALEELYFAFKGRRSSLLLGAGLNFLRALTAVTVSRE